MTYERQESLCGGRIIEIEPGSPAERAGLVVGDIVVAVEGEPVHDVLDVMWLADEDTAEFEVVNAEGVSRGVLLERSDHEGWGYHFEDILFDGIRRCKNDCAFCFMTQLPRDMRSSLYVRDDDYRLSFLQGNFVTLTNLTDEDSVRIVEQRLSPLYVSLHAVDAQVRERLVGRHHAMALQRFDELVEAGIELNVQIVLVPGINDGPVLEETLAWLRERRPQVASVGIVPVAYTDQTKDIAGEEPSSYTDQLSAATVIQQVQKHQFELRAEAEMTWVHLADEFYINAKAPFPTPEWYDGFPQYENGIGIVWGFVEEVREIFDELKTAIDSLDEGLDQVTLVTGELATETMLGTLSALCAGGRVRLLPVRNRFFGGNVSVTGLITGQDLVAAVRYDNERVKDPTTYLIPDIIFNADGLTLDDYTQERIVEETGARVIFRTTDAQGILDGLNEVLALRDDIKE